MSWICWKWKKILLRCSSNHMINPCNGLAAKIWFQNTTFPLFWQVFHSIEEKARPTEKICFMIVNYYSLTHLLAYFPRSDSVPKWVWLPRCITCLAPTPTLIIPSTDMGKISAARAASTTIFSAVLYCCLILSRWPACSVFRIVKANLREAC